MSAGFTPGPWEVEHHELSEGFSAIVYDARGYAVADHLDKANANLIAAAPDLFEALEDFDNWFCGFNPDDQASRMEGRKAVIRARAALARARATTIPDDREREGS